MPEPRKPAGTDRRAAERHPCQLQTSCLLATGASQMGWPARVLDISKRGVGLLIERRFEPGTLLTFRLESPSDGRASYLMARVVRATPEPGTANAWRLGCVLLDELDPADLRAFRAGAHVMAELIADALRRGLTGNAGSRSPAPPAPG